jgi:hypothetical protein
VLPPAASLFASAPPEPLSAPPLLASAPPALLPAVPPFAPPVPEPTEAPAPLEPEDAPAPFAPAEPAAPVPPALRASRLLSSPQAMPMARADSENRTAGRYFMNESKRIPCNRPTTNGHFLYRTRLSTCCETSPWWNDATWREHRRFVIERSERGHRAP